MLDTIKKLRTYLDGTKNSEMILVYQMGKVGSSSITNSLKSTNVLYKHKHSYYKRLKFNQFNKYRSTKLSHSLMYALPDKVLERLRQFVKRKTVLRKTQGMKIITLVREPIGRNMSMYFQDIYIPIFEYCSTHSLTSEGEMGSSVLIMDFFENFNHSYGNEWFDCEFKKVMKTDVYDYPFDKELGYCIVKKLNMEILILQMEKLDKLEQIIGEFSGVADFKLANSNRGEKKWYASIYNEFKKNINYSEEYIDNLYDSRFMKHFYSEQDILRFRKKYLKEEDNG